MNLGSVAALRAVRTVHERYETQLAAVSAEEKAAVYAGRAAGLTVQEIADALGRVQPAVSRQYGPFPPAGTGDPDSRAAAVRRLRKASATRRRVVERGDLAKVKAVAAARAADVTWQLIAEAMGQHFNTNVVNKFKPLLRETAGGVEAAPVPPRSRARLSPEQRAELTRRVRAGEPVTGLVAEFGVSASYVRNLRRRR